MNENDERGRIFSGKWQYINCIAYRMCIYMYVCIFDTRLLSPVSDNQIRFGKKYKARVNP